MNIDLTEVLQILVLLRSEWRYLQHWWWHSDTWQLIYSIESHFMMFINELPVMASTIETFQVNIKRSLVQTHVYDLIDHFNLPHTESHHENWSILFAHAVATCNKRTKWLSKSVIECWLAEATQYETASGGVDWMKLTDRNFIQCSYF